MLSVAAPHAVASFAAQPSACSEDGDAGSYPCDRTVDITDSAGRHVASFPGDGWAIAWSPDGASLLVHGGMEVPVDGSTPRQLSVDDPRAQSMATYSPDGAEIAYVSQDGLGVAAADGSQARVLVPGALDKDFPLTPYGLEWSPTGDRIAFVRATGERTGQEGPGTELAVLDVASRSVVPLAETGAIGKR
jgi:Tol biopolymer transport system component